MGGSRRDGALEDKGEDDVEEAEEEVHTQHFPMTTIRMASK